MSKPNQPIVLPADARILVVAMRRLGDVLLTTPLIRSVKRAFPSASIEALVFAGTEGILSGNPDLAGVLTIPERASVSESFALLRRLIRRYDLALTTQTGDRPTALQVVAGRQNAGPPDAGRSSAAIHRAVLVGRGLATAVVGAPADRAYLDTVWGDTDVGRLDGQLTWPELSALIGSARIYVGPDTAVTHLAAATGTQTVALYGPTDPRIWGPWPRNGLDRPWDASGTIQHRDNVWLVQNPLPCMPCQLEGCERRLDSHSQCLDELSAAHVVTAVDHALAIRRAA